MIDFYEDWSRRRERYKLQMTIMKEAITAALTWIKRIIEKY